MRVILLDNVDKVVDLVLAWEVPLLEGLHGHVYSVAACRESVQ